MCLHVKNIPEDLNPQLATEDISCYKLLQIATRGSEIVYITPYRNFRINFDYENKCCIAVDKMSGEYYAFLDNESYPSSENDLHIFYREMKWINGKKIQHLIKVINPVSEGLHIYTGIHAYTKYFKCDLCEAILKKNLSFCKAIIPKGAYYFVGDNYDIVADKMIIFDEIIK